MNSGWFFSRFQHQWKFSQKPPHRGNSSSRSDHLLFLLSPSRAISHQRTKRPYCVLANAKCYPQESSCGLYCGEFSPTPKLQHSQSEGLKFAALNINTMGIHKLVFEKFLQNAFFSPFPSLKMQCPWFVFFCLFFAPGSWRCALLGQMQVGFSEEPPLGHPQSQCLNSVPSVQLSRAKGNTVTQQQGFH